MSLEHALQTLRLHPRFTRHVVAWRHVPARPPRFAAFPDRLAGQLTAALAGRGIRQLYTHQAAAVAAALEGAHVAVVTPAASGKTLCYNLPVLDRLLAEPAARALYLFPTKALAQDQLAGLGELMAALGDKDTRTQQDKTMRQSERIEEGESRNPSPPLPLSPSPLLTPATYDGDTPSSQRARIRDTARIILSNPDMLHVGILPQHPRWAAFFAGLRVVVIDEMHVYRGVFGSHVANVLRRLRRICRFYGSAPQFILASATIANPGELAARLVEAPVTVIGPEQDGAPAGARHVLFYNPPLVDPALGIRRSSSLEAADLAAHLLRHDVQTILFARARLTAELMLTDLRERVGAGGRRQEAGGKGQEAGGRGQETGDRGQEARGKGQEAGGKGQIIANHKYPIPNTQYPLPTTQSIRGYRGGYLPAERRAIEAGLRDGSVRGVVATNALELGVDIGQLDAAVLAGYPGTIASAWQQMGRAGRRQGSAVAVLVAAADALDQYIIAHPEYLLTRSPEHALINPDNAIILAGHLACAAAELPLEAGECLGDADPGLVSALLEDLVAAGQLYRAGSRCYWAGAGTPATAISLRSAAADRVVIQASQGDESPQVIGELDRFSVPLLLYEGAVYIHEGATYLVDQLDWAGGIAHVRPVDVDFYTRPSIGEEVVRLRVADVGSSDNQSEIRNPKSEIHWGDVRVISRATGYKMLRRGTNEVLGFGPIDLPEQTLETQACWLTFGQALIDELRAAGQWFSDPNDYGPEWATQRDAARARAGYRCQNCGAPEPVGGSSNGVTVPETANRKPVLRPVEGSAIGNQHHVHHKIPFRAFLADPSLRPGLPADQAWRAANQLGNLVTLCPACHRRAEATVRVSSGLGGVATLLAGVAPLFLMCDRRDLGVIVEPEASGAGPAGVATQGPTITIYEQAPAGVGYAAQMWAAMPEMLRAAYDLVTGCPCERGCPGCVGPVLEHAYALDTKALARDLLAKCLAHEAQ